MDQTRTTRHHAPRGDDPARIDLSQTVPSPPGAGKGTPPDPGAYRWRPFSPLPPGVNRTSVPGCVLEAVLGSGGMGTVYLARQTNLDRQVAVKVLNRHFADNPQFIARLRREAHIMGTMSHPCLVGCHDIIVTQNGASIVMEYIPGHLDGRNLVKMLGPMPERHVVKVLLAISRALDHAYAHGIIHRDVKPENILFAFNRGRAPRSYDELFRAPELRIALCDFGIADARKDLHGNEGGSAAQKSQVMGSPLYMAPEQAVFPDQLDFRSDIYALGATGYYLLTGKPPFEGKDWESIMELKVQSAIPAPKAPSLRISAELSRIIARMGALLPEERYDGYRQLIRELEAVELLNADRDQGFFAFLHGHKRPLLTMAGILTGVWLLAYGAVRWYERWLDDIEQRVPPQTLSMQNWDGAIRSWRQVIDRTSGEQFLTGLPGSRSITLKQRLFEGDYIRISMAMSGSGTAIMTFRTAADESRMLGRIACAIGHDGLRVRLYTVSAAGGTSVPVPMAIPDQYRSDGGLELRVEFHDNYFSVWNRRQLLGIVHFDHDDIANGACFNVAGIPEKTRVRFRNIIVVPSRSARSRNGD